MLRIPVLFLTFCLLLRLPLFSQNEQLEIPRIQMMPDFPQDYEMINWKQLSLDYDTYIFDQDLTGTHLPLVSFGTQGINFPDISPIYLDTYVGTNSQSQAEAINLIPAIVGATLVGRDKTSHYSVNWVEKIKEYYNQANGQNVYLNNYSAKSGGDWWYDVMPNVFFYQLYAQYPNIPGFESQFISVADQWLAAVHAMGGSASPWSVPYMNYWAFDLESMTPVDQGVKQPESAGSISWLLYHAYLKTGEEKYLTGAQLSMEFLSNWDSNPSYELQLSYGAFAAAKMNAELGASYDLDKILNWTFDRGPIRGWGSIVGNWRGQDVSGLIGEANDNGNDYAFVMNGFQQAAALIPLVKYDKRYARSIAKWTLNLANASRHFYPDQIESDFQDDYDWVESHPGSSVIAYEALREVWQGKDLYATGDAKGGNWAATNLSLYSSSSVGYLGALLQESEVQGILLLDVNKSDFFLDRSDLPSYLVYNPHDEDKTISITTAESSDVYDAISEEVILEDQMGSAEITLEPGGVKLLVYVPAGSTLEEIDGRLMLGDQVVDYHFGYDFNPLLRIKSLSAEAEKVELNRVLKVYSTVENEDPENTTFTWLIDDEEVGETATGEFEFLEEANTGLYKITSIVQSGDQEVTASIYVEVVDFIPLDPDFEGFDVEGSIIEPDQEIMISLVKSEDEALDNFEYDWAVSAGEILEETEGAILWKAPDNPVVVQLSCTITNEFGLQTVIQDDFLVKSFAGQLPEPLFYLPLDRDVLDYSENALETTRVGGSFATDAKGEEESAFRFNSSADVIHFNSDESILDVNEPITVSFWLRVNLVPEEMYVVSHGSWEQRWKISVLEDRKLRWTINSGQGIVDLDTSFPLASGTWYHFTTVYSGYSMEIYVDGVLNSFTSHSGLLGQTNQALTIGKKELGEDNFYLRGIIDEVRLYNEDLAPEAIAQLPEIWNEKEILSLANPSENLGIHLYPNPAKGLLKVRFEEANAIRTLALYDTQGRAIAVEVKEENKEELILDLTPLPSGVFLLKMDTEKGRVVRRVVKN